MAKNNEIRKIGVLTGGGDCPGLNAVIRGVTKPAQDHGMTVIGILDGFEGFVEGKTTELRDEDVSGFTDPCHFPPKCGDRSLAGYWFQRGVQNLRRPCEKQIQRRAWLYHHEYA